MSRPVRLPNSRGVRMHSGTNLDYVDEDMDFEEQPGSGIFAGVLVILLALVVAAMIAGIVVLFTIFDVGENPAPRETEGEYVGMVQHG